MTSTTSTVPAVKTKLVALLTTQLATASLEGGQVQVGYAWPGPDTKPESVFLGRHPGLLVDPAHGVQLSSQIPNIKAGRKQRQEDYGLELTVWSFRPELTPADAAIAEAQGFVLLGHIEDGLAEDPHLGLGTVVQSATVAAIEVALIPFQSGWASVITPSIEVKARLT